MLPDEMIVEVANIYKNILSIELISAEVPRSEYIITNTNKLG